MEQQSSETASPSQPASSLATTIDIFASPSEAFRTIQKQPRILFPLFLVLIPTFLIYLWYFQMVDFDWFIDDTVARFSGMSAEQQEAMRNAYEAQSQTFTTVTTVLGAVVGTLFFYLVHAGYLTLVSAMTGDGYRFRYWFSLLSWTNLPFLFILLVMAVNLLMSPNGQISLYDANSLSLASLGMEASSAGMQAMLDSLNLAMFWALALLVMAYRQWLKISWMRASLIALAPYILVFGGIAFFTLT